MKAVDARFEFDDRKLSVSGAASVSLAVEEWREIGIEASDSPERDTNVVLLINRGTHDLRIPEGASIFRALLDYCVSLKGFDWRSLVNAKNSCDVRYFLCWKACELVNRAETVIENACEHAEKASLFRGLVSMIWVNAILPILGGCA